MPPSATSNRPVREVSAPVKAPRQCPNNSLSIRFSGSAPQLTATNGLSARKARFMDRAGDQFFAAAGFSANEHGAFGRCDFGDQRLDFLHRLAAADQLRIPSARRRRCSRAARRFLA